MSTIKVTKIKELDFDFYEERKRLREFLKGDELKAHLELIDAFLGGDPREKIFELFESLPYNKRNECSGAELVGAWFWFTFYGDYMRGQRDEYYYEIN
jgi:hypothetical protein